MHLYARRILWFAGFWLAGVIAVASVGYLIKLVIG
jgi:hypothetical protein